MEDNQQSRLSSISPPRRTKSEQIKQSSIARSDSIYTNLSRILTFKPLQLAPHQQQVIVLENRLSQFRKHKQELLERLQVAQRAAYDHSQGFTQEEMQAYRLLERQRKALKQRLQGEEDSAERNYYSASLAIVEAKIQRFKSSLNTWIYGMKLSEDQIRHIKSQLKLCASHLNRLGKHLLKEYWKLK